MDMGKAKASRAQVTALATICTLLTCGCAGATGLQRAFDSGAGLRGESAEPLLREIDGRERLPAVPGAVGVTGRGLVGRALPDGELWEYIGPVETLPLLDAGVVGTSGEGKVTLLDLRSGKILWTLDGAGRQLSALAHDGRHTLLVLADPHDSRPELVLIVDEAGRRLHSALSEPAVGRPAAVAGLALVPWGGRHVAAIDLAQGALLGTFDVASATTAVVPAQTGMLLLGEGVVALRQDVLTEPRPLPLQLPAKNLPGAPRWPGDGTVTLEPRPFPVALYASPVLESERPTFAGERFASTYHRVVLGFDTARGELRWTTHFLREVLGGASSREALTVCLEDGSLWRLSWRDGSRSSSGSLQSRLRACVVTPDPRPVEAQRPVPLAEQVAGTLTDTGPDMAPVHELLLDELSANPSPDVTRLLVEITRSPRASAELAEKAARRLAMRRSGAEHLITALRESMDFDVRKRPAPLAAIASALFAMNAREGSGPLAQHLVDPRTPMADQLMLARVLRVLAGPEQVEELTEYFSLYRTAAAEPELAQAVLLTAQTLWTIGGPDARALVLEAARDPMTHPNVRSELEKLIASGGQVPGSEGAVENAPPGTRAPDSGAANVVDPPKN
jgi:hypothetical protein